MTTFKSFVAVGAFLSAMFFTGSEATASLDVVLVHIDTVYANFSVSHTSYPSRGITAQNISCVQSANDPSGCESASFEVNSDPSVHPGYIYVSGLSPGNDYRMHVGYITLDGPPENKTYEAFYSFCTKPEQPTFAFTLIDETTANLSNVSVPSGRYDRVQITIPGGATPNPAVFEGNTTSQVLSGLTNGNNYSVSAIAMVGTSTGCQFGQVLNSETVRTSYQQSLNIIQWTLTAIYVDGVEFGVVNLGYPSDSPVPGDVMCSSSSGGQCPVNHTVQGLPGQIVATGLTPGTAYNLSIGYLTRGGVNNDSVSGMALFCTKPDVPTMTFERLNGTAINITSVTVSSGGFDAAQLSFSPGISGNPISITGNPIPPLVVEGLSPDSVTYTITTSVEIGSSTACGYVSGIGSEDFIVNYTSIGDSVDLTLVSVDTNSVSFTVANPAFVNDVTVAGDVMCLNSTGGPCPSGHTVQTSAGKIDMSGLTAGTGYNISVGYLTRNNTFNDTVTGMDIFCTKPSVPTGINAVRLNATSANFTELVVDGNFDNGTVTIDPPDAGPIMFTATTIYETTYNLTEDTTYNISVVLSVGSTTNCGSQGIVNGDIFFFSYTLREDTGNAARETSALTSLMITLGVAMLNYFF